MNKCPNCGRENVDGAKICTYCGSLLVDTKEHAATKALENADFEENIPKWGSSRFNQRVNLIVTTDQGEHKLGFDTGNIVELVMGRSDSEADDAPEIDLSRYGAQDKGVSRRHASIIRKDGSLHVVDKGSYNGTFLNGQRLIADQPRVLRDGDDIRLGYLVLRVSFERN
ncbi:MAG: FHA domain-containing protein [Anaerolineae bacterium]|nr:FHA domain-containing protein [Anaerolineae bacterium]